MPHAELENPDALKVIAREPFNLHFDGMAKAVAAENEVGPFSVMPGHADFFSMLTPCQVEIVTDKEESVTFEISNGIITVCNNEVLLFVNM